MVVHLPHSVLRSYVGCCALSLHPIRLPGSLIVQLFRHCFLATIVAQDAY